MSLAIGHTDGVTPTHGATRSVAYFKGVLVVVRHIDVTVVTLTRTDLLELNMVRKRNVTFGA